jgi:hypothetical protein
MKKLMIAVAALMVSIAAYGQGQFIFNNRSLPDVNAPFVTDTGVKLSGTDYTVQLLGGAQGTAVGSLVALGTTNFRTGTGAGYVNALSPVVPGVSGGKNADILLQVFAGATATGAPLSTFGPYSVALAEAPATPVPLALGLSPLVVTTIPEPATLALGVLGLGALLAIRRRS